MRSSTLILSLWASLAVAQPHKQGHQHAKHHEARNQPAIKWVTEYEYTTEVIPVTTTIWVSEGFVAPTTTSASSATAKASVPAQFFQPVNKKPASSTTLSTAVSAAPAPVSTTSAQPTTTTTSIPPLPPAAEAVEPSTSTTTSTTAIPTTVVPVYTPPPPAEPATTVAPVTSSYVAPVVVAPVVVAPVVAAVPSSASSAASSGGPCSKGAACTGDMTYYEAGLGACGWTNNGAAEDVVALSHKILGTQSNGNPYCGKTITIKYKGKSIVAKVVDKCMGCEYNDIDLSNHAFDQLASQDDGRVDAEWYFN